MGAIHIENVEDRIVNSIRLRADRNGRSFEDEVLAVLAGAAEAEGSAVSPAERRARFAALRAMTPKDVVQTDSTDMIREMRDRGYADY